VPAGKVRLRLLNGANARFYILTFADNRTFHKVATDGGLMERPVPMTTMEMAPGERCEIIVDLSDGASAGLLTLFEDEWDEEGEGILSGLMNLFGGGDKPLPPPTLTLVPDPELPANTAALPETLATITRPAESEIVRTRDFILDMDHDGTEFVVRFDHTASEAHPYMYHCHILEHEDRGMMGQFTVT